MTGPPLDVAQDTGAAVCEEGTMGELLLDPVVLWAALVHSRRPSAGRAIAHLRRTHEHNASATIFPIYRKRFLGVNERRKSMIRARS
jgi:hypothetical protein